MRASVVVSMVFLLTACAGSPPQPPLPQGEYRPVNASMPRATQNVFDFAYEGDILDVLPALRRVVPRLNVMPSLGNPIAVKLGLDLHAVTLEEALRDIGKEAGDAADILWNPERNQVFLRFRSPLASGAANGGEKHE